MKYEYTVVLEMSHPTALKPNQPMRVFVLPTGSLPASDYEAFREAAAKGGSQVLIWTVPASGVEDVKWELMHSSTTRCD